jgi:hypothetical protein
MHVQIGSKLPLLWLSYKAVVPFDCATHSTKTGKREKWQPRPALPGWYELQQHITVMDTIACCHNRKTQALIVGHARKWVQHTLQCKHP